MSVIYSFDINKKLETDKINLEFCTHRGNPAFRYKDNTQKQSVTLSLSALDAPQERCPLGNMPGTTNTHTFESYLTSKAPEDLIDRLKNAKLKNKSAGAAITVMQELGYIIPIVSGERTKIYTALSILLGDIGDAKSVTAYINNRPLSSTDRDALLRLLESPQDL